MSVSSPLIMVHYNVYYNGHIGTINALMSVENGLILALLTNQNITFYQSGSLFNSTKGLSIFDLYDIDFDYHLIKKDKISQTVPRLPSDLHNIVLYKDSYPSPDFLNDRQTIIRLRNKANIATKDFNTLGFYSYLFSLSDYDKEQVKNLVKNRIKPKQKYQDIANEVLGTLPATFNVINVRRGDFLYIPGMIANQIEVEDFISVIDYHFDKNIPLLIVTDETDKSYFSRLEQEGYQTIYIQDLLVSYSELDLAEKGLVALIIAAKSADFIGTLKSTYSAMIQRYRLYNGLQEDFKYLYSTHPDLVLEHGKFKEENDGENSWNLLNLPQEFKSQLFWTREWKESYS